VAEHDAVRVEAVQLLQRGGSLSLIPSVVAEVASSKLATLQEAWQHTMVLVASSPSMRTDWCPGVCPGVAMIQTPLATSWSPFDHLEVDVRRERPLRHRVEASSRRFDLGVLHEDLAWGKRWF
jgi:hypothetical protein